MDQFVELLLTPIGYGYMLWSFLLPSLSYFSRCEYSYSGTKWGIVNVSFMASWLVLVTFYILSSFIYEWWYGIIFFIGQFIILSCLNGIAWGIFLRVTGKDPRIWLGKIAFNLTLPFIILFAVYIVEMIN